REWGRYCTVKGFRAPRLMLNACEKIVILGSVGPPPNSSSSPAGASDARDRRSKDRQILTRSAAGQKERAMNSDKHQATVPEGAGQFRFAIRENTRHPESAAPPRGVHAYLRATTETVGQSRSRRNYRIDRGLLVPLTDRPLH